MKKNRTKQSQSLSPKNSSIWETWRAEVYKLGTQTSAAKKSKIRMRGTYRDFWLAKETHGVLMQLSVVLLFVLGQKIVEGGQSIIKLPSRKYLNNLESILLVISRNLMKRALLDDLKVCSSLTDPQFFQKLSYPIFIFIFKSPIKRQAKRDQPKLIEIIFVPYLQGCLLLTIACLDRIQHCHQKIVLLGQLKQGVYNLIQVELMESQVSVAVIRELLQKMASEEVTQAEQRMRELVNNKDFFALIFSILSGKQQQEWTRTMAASFLNHQFSQTLSEQNSQVIYEAIVQILSHPQIKDLDKRILQKSIIKCLEESTQVQNQKWLSFIDSCLNNYAFLDTAFLVIACIAVADIPSNLIEKVITQTYDIILTRIQVSIQNANLVNQMLKMWIVIIDKLSQDKKMRNFLQTMISSPSLFKTINGIYELGSYNNTIMCVESGLAELNFLKYEAAQLNKRMLEIEAEQSGDALPRILDFTRPYLLKFAATLSTMAAKRSLIQTTNSDDLVTSLVSIVRLYLTIKPQQFTLEDSISFQNHIIFPFLAIDDVEMDRFQQNPEDFNSLAQDCCDKQTFGILKTEVAKLLQCLGDKVQGSLKYAINRAVQSINIKFGYSPTYVFKDLQVLQFETAMMVLSIFSYGISKYPEQTATLSKLLSDQRAKTLPPLQLARVFIFLAYNYTEVFKDPAQGEGWLNLAISYKAHPTTRYCAFDCFSNIIQDYFNEAFLGKICEQIQGGNIGLVWQIASKLIEKHFTSLSNNAFSLIASKLFLRIQKQMQLINNKQKNDTLDIINCLRVFANISKQLKKESKENQERKEYIISVVWPILDFYQEAIEYNVEDEIVRIAIELVNAMDILSPEIYRYASQFIFVFRDEGSHYSQKIYFKFFNQLLIKANFERDQDEIIKILVVLKDSVLNSLSKLTQKKISRNKKDYKIKPIQHYRLALCNALLVIQNSIAYFGTHLIKLGSKQFFEEMSSLCVRILPQSDNEQIQRTPSGYIILARALNTLFLCHMHLKIDSIYDYLRRLQNEKIYHGYDTKVIVMCIAKQIFQENDISAIVFLLTTVSKFIQLSEAKDELLDKNKKKKKNAIKINTQMKKIEDFDKIIGQLDSPFKNDKDVFEVLTELFAEMKHGNAAMFNAIMTALPAEALNYFNKYIDFEHLEKKRRVFRKVVGIKMNSSVPNTIQTEEGQKDSEKMNEGSDDDEQDLGFKRKRAKVKAENKRNKMIKLQKKRQHVEDEQA